MVCNYGFENMNEFYLSYRESKMAYEDYQQEVVEKWQKSPDNQNNALEERMLEKIERLQGLEKDIQYYGIQIKDRESR